MSLEQAHALDPQPYLLLVMSDFEMLSPESVKAFLYVIYFFFLLPILHVQSRKFAAQAWRRPRDLFSDLLTHNSAAY